MMTAAMSSNFYRGRDKPKYLLGHGLELGFVAMGLISVVLLRLNYQRINKKRDRVTSSSEVSRNGSGKI